MINFFLLHFFFVSFFLLSIVAVGRGLIVYDIRVYVYHMICLIQQWIIIAQFIIKTTPITGVEWNIFTYYCLQSGPCQNNLLAIADNYTRWFCFILGYSHAQVAKTWYGLNCMTWEICQHRNKCCIREIRLSFCRHLYTIYCIKGIPDVTVPRDYLAN